MAKRKTKAQREKEQRAALTQRVADIVAGVVGGDPPWTADDDCLLPAQLSPVISAIASRLDTAKHRAEWMEGGHGWMKEQPTWLWSPVWLENYETVETIVDHLWEHGVRA